MPPTAADPLRLPRRPGWCTARGLALIAFWLALVAGFVAETTIGVAAPGGTRTAAQRAVTVAPAS